MIPGGTDPFFNIDIVHMILILPEAYISLDQKRF